MIENYKEIPLGRAKDLSQQRFGKLTAIYRTENKGKQTQWLCQCDCGKYCVVSMSHLISKHTTSCGCYKKLASFDDITGQRFGRLLVLGYDRTEGKGHTYWKCKCDCGVEKSIRKDGLISGAVISCGCFIKEQTSKLFTKDLTGQLFGNLTVIERVGSDNHNNALWLCQCKCGVKKIIPGQSLIKGQSKSCGCIKSQGEYKIKQLLLQYNIPFTTEKTFSTCIFNDTSHKAKFDFYINNQYLIEYDGEQHFKSGSGWNTKEKLEKTRQHDKIKNEWCKENNIPLIRIPYYHLDNLVIDDLQLKTSKFLYVGEN